MNKFEFYVYVPMDLKSIYIYALWDTLYQLISIANNVYSISGKKQSILTTIPEITTPTTTPGK